MIFRRTNILDAISDFHFELLPQEWVNTIWSRDCFDDKELPSDYELQLENNDYLSLMVTLIDALERWDVSFVPNDSRSSQSPSQGLSKSWSVLCNIGVDYKSLLCVLSVFLNNEIEDMSLEKHSLVLTASKLYFVILSIPGSLAFNVFNQIIYDQALKVLTYVSLVSNKKNKRYPKASKKKLDQINLSADSGHVNIFSSLQKDERNDILSNIYQLCEALSQCLKVLHLRDEEESLIRTIQVLVSLTQLETCNVFQNTKADLICQIVLKSYQVLEELCSVSHGDIEHIIVLMFRSFLPTLIIRDEDIKITLKGQVAFNINTFIFIKNLVNNHEDKSVLGVKAVIQQLCVRMPDRADIRAKVIPHIIQLLKLLSGNVFQDIILWIVSLAHAEVIKYRVCAIELISKLLNVTEDTSGDLLASDYNVITEDAVITENICVDTVSNQNNYNLLHKLLVGAILSRSLDGSAILRSKCLSIFASLMHSNQKEVKEIMEELFISPYNDVRKNTPGEENKPYFDFQDYFSSHSQNPSLPKNPLPSAVVIISTTEKLVQDLKVFVRKGALQVLTNACLLNTFWLNERIKIFIYSCRDNSLLIRKLSVKCLTDLLLKYPFHNLLLDAWVQGVVSLSADDDIKCQEKVIEAMGTVLLENLVDYGKAKNDFTELPWKILNIIAKSGKRLFFRLVCQKWSVNKTITKKTFELIESHIDTEHNFSAWFLIVCLTEYLDCPDPTFVSNYFLKNNFDLDSGQDCIILLVVEALFLNWKGFDEQSQNLIYAKFKASLESFTVPLTLISRYLDICYIANNNEASILCQKLIHLCEEYLKSHIAPGCLATVHEPTLCRYIHSLGDASQFRPGVKRDIMYYLADIVDPTSLNRGMNLKWQGTVSSTVKAVAIVTLGKICLQDQFVAKIFAPVLATALNESSEGNVKINAMIALTDLCSRFTSVAEDFLGDMCTMLKDENIDVRKNSLKLLLQLLQEDYLKPKGALFFYLLITLRDPVTSIREMTDSFISSMLLKRNSSIMSQFFVQAVFFFNDFEGSGSFSKENLSKKERKVFSMAGVRNFDERGNIYKYMLSNMRDDHRFKLCNRICGDILDEVVDGNIPLDNVGSSVLKDALFAMACDEMRLENLRKSEEDLSDKETEDSFETGGSEAVLGIAKKAFISRIVKANYVEYIVPTIIKLKRKLADVKSPLVRDLMICLRELMKDFKEEINDILHADPVLAAEVSLDLKNISREEESVHDIFQEFNIREVRISCERLSEKVLSEKMGISIAAIKLLQSQSLSLSKSQSETENPGPSAPREVHRNEDMVECSYEKFPRNGNNSLSDNEFESRMNHNITNNAKNEGSSLKDLPRKSSGEMGNKSSSSSSSSPELVVNKSSHGKDRKYSCSPLKSLRNSQESETSTSTLSSISSSELSLSDSQSMPNNSRPGRQLRVLGTREKTKRRSQDSRYSNSLDLTTHVDTKKRAKCRRK